MVGTHFGEYTRWGRQVGRMGDYWEIAWIAGLLTIRLVVSFVRLSLCLRNEPLWVKGKWDMLPSESCLFKVGKWDMILWPRQYARTIHLRHLHTNLISGLP